MPLSWDSPIAIDVPIAMVAQTALRACDARELTEDNYEEFWAAILADNILMINGKRIGDCSEIDRQMVKDVYQDLIGFTWWRS